jgi:hypothetical protein
MNTYDENYLVEFEIYNSEDSPSKITERLGLEPTFSRTNGEDILHKATGKTLRIASENRWQLESSLPKGSGVEEQFAQLLEVLRPHKEVIQKILSNAECIWQISGRSNQESGQVAMNIPSKIVIELCEYNAEIDIDIYWHDK